MAAIRWKSLSVVVAVHAALIMFILAATHRDRISEPTMETRQTEIGPILDWVPQPFAFGACVPGTTSLREEGYISGDEGLGRPIYRCAGWTRPLLWSVAAVLSIMTVAWLVSLGGNFVRRRRA
jgi:hypothetical protein